MLNHYTSTGTLQLWRLLLCGIFVYCKESAMRKHGQLQNSDNTLAYSRESYYQQ